MKKTSGFLSILLVVAILFVALGIATLFILPARCGTAQSIGSQSSPPSSNAGKTYNDGYREGLQACESPKTTHSALPQKQPTTYSFFATLAEISSNKLTVQLNKSGDEDSPTRNVLVTDATILERRIPKTPKQRSADAAAFKKTLEAFNRTATERLNIQGDDIVGSQTLAPTPPVGYISTPFKISDLKTGDNLRVEVGKDLRQNAEAEAISIEYLPGTNSSVTPPEDVAK